ncbi:MAG: DUF6768 family protein [Planctomycetota bacterium]
MNDIDNKIREALRAEDAATLSQFPGDDSLSSTLFTVYQGQRRWINSTATVVTFLLFALQIWCGVRFFQSESTQALIGWSTGFLTLFVWIVMMKLWFWLEMLRNSVTREVKRLELQVALLNQAQPDDSLQSSKSDSDHP